MPPTEAELFLLKLQKSLNEDLPVLTLMIEYLIVTLDRLGPDFKSQFLAVLESDTPSDGDAATIKGRVRDLFKGILDDAR